MSQNDKEDRIYYVMGHGCSMYPGDKEVLIKHFLKTLPPGSKQENIFVECIGDISTISNIVKLGATQQLRTIYKMTGIRRLFKTIGINTRKFAPYKNTHLPKILQIAYTKLKRIEKQIIEDVKNDKYGNIFVLGVSAGGAFVNCIAERLNEAAKKIPEIQTKVQIATFGSIWLWRCPKEKQHVQLYNYVSRTDVSQLCSGRTCRKSKPLNTLFKITNPICDFTLPKTDIENDKNVIPICLYQEKDDNKYERICNNIMAFSWNEHNSYFKLIITLLYNKRLDIYDPHYELAYEPVSHSKTQTRSKSRSQSRSQSSMSPSKKSRSRIVIEDEIINP
jgi:hypothetical protein